MSSFRNNASRYNTAFVHSDTSRSSFSSSSTQPSQHEKSSTSTPPGPFYYHHHKGHKRGHSYGGPVSPTTAAFHHARLEARPSHHLTTTHAHGTGTLPQVQVTNSVLMKGHRRALSGCMPMVGGMGIMAWSSLRELQATNGLHATLQGLRSRSPIEIPDNFRSSSPEGKKSGLDFPGSKSTRSLSPHDSSDSGVKVESLSGMECVLGPFVLPSYFNAFANIKVFVAILALLVTLQQAVASGYVNSVITTIELRFEIPSKYTGLVASAYEMGNVVTVLFVSYLGAKRHIPRWIAFGVLFMVIGCIVFTLPHFLSKDPFSSESNGNSNSYFLARLTQHERDVYEFNSTELSRTNLSSQNLSAISNTYFLNGKNSICHSRGPLKPSKFISTRQRGSEERELNEQFPSVQSEPIEFYSFGCGVEVSEDGTNHSVEPESYGHPLILFMIAQILLGCGGSPLFTLGITYVDDHVPKESSSIYIGIVYAMAAFGPVLGFLMGAWLLIIPASLSAPVNPDSQFIGMWWGGFLIVGFFLTIVCIPFLTFPRFLQKNSKNLAHEVEFVDVAKGINDQSISEEVVEADYGQSIRDIPRSMLRLIKNPIYVVTCLAGCMEMNIISGFVVFLPKYLETQFGMGKSEASVFTGGIAIPGAFFGILAGGYIMKRLKLTPSGAAKFIVITSCVCLIGHACFFFLGCTNPKLAGATVPYPDSNLPKDFTPLNINLTSGCNSDCSCDSSLDAQYVCHNGITYFSPCHAGCSGNLSQCTCAGEGEVVPGVCPDAPCYSLAPFMIVLFFMTATVAMMQMPSLMIVLRSVSEEERSFALGMQFVLFRLLGYIPSPIIFGNVIDSACLLWSVRKCSTLLPALSGRCLRYDILDFRYKYVGMLTGFKLMALLLFLYNYFQLVRLEIKENEKKIEELGAEESLKIRSNSLYSLDKLFEENNTDLEELNYDGTTNEISQNV